MGTPRIAATAQAPCGIDARDLGALADGEHDDHVAAALRGHVAGCHDCRARWRGIVDVRRLLVAATATDRVPADLMASLAAITG